MRSSLGKLEMCSCIAIIAASLLLCYVLITDFVIPPHAISQGGRNTALKGQSLSISGVDWSKSNRSLVLAVSSHCPYCVMSTGFYKDLSDARIKAQFPVQLIAAMPEDTDVAKSFLESHQVKVDRLENTSLLNLNVAATPTLVMVDNHGKLVDEWVGKLSLKDEKEVIRTLVN